MKSIMAMAIGVAEKIPCSKNNQGGTLYRLQSYADVFAGTLAEISHKINNKKKKEKEKRK